MQLYGLKTCDTCRAARKALPAAAFFDVRSDGIPDELLERAQDTFGAALLNTRSTTWRGLTAQERERPALELLKAHPALMKRPLVVTPNGLHLGWGPDVRSALGVD